MPLKVGNRVTVLPGVSNLKDVDCLRFCGEKGLSREHLVGKVGEIVQIGKDGPATCPPGYEWAYLVDSQMVKGKPVGLMDMREWLFAEEIEVG